MKVGLIVYGSNCDVDPMVALAVGLAERGHTVELLIISIHDRDYTFLNCHDGIRVRQKPYHAAVRNRPGEDLEYWNQPMENHFDLMDRWYKATVSDIVDRSYEFCETCDLVVGPQHVLETACIAEKFGVPYVSLRTLPAHVRSSNVAPYWLSFFDMGDMSNDEQWDLLESHENKSLKRYINKFRRQHGMTPIKNVMREVVNSSRLNLISYSRRLYRQQDDWDPTFHLCGFFRNPPYLNWEPPRELEAFWGGDEKPVFISLYSMLEYENDKEAVRRLLVEAAAQTDRKVIIHANGWEQGALSEKIYKLGGIVSFPDILAHCGVAVHHGGIGFSHIATEAGCPSVIIQYGCDHPFNAGVLRRAGVCARSIDRTALTADKLATMIQDTLTMPELTENAQALRAAMVKEDGVSNAVTLLERTFSATSATGVH